AELRLHQYVLHGLYDPTAVARLGLLGDPAVTRLSPDTLHVIAEQPDGLVLSYLCMQPAEQPWRRSASHGPLRRDTPFALGDRGRGLFPVESDLFGPAVFAALPTADAVPVARVREFAHLLRNHTVSSRLGRLASIEVALAGLNVLRDGVQQVQLT